MEHCLRALSAKKRTLLAMANVVGVGICLKEKRGVQTDRLAVGVLVSKKVAKEDLPVEHVVPMKIGEVDTDVIEVGELHLLAEAAAGEVDSRRVTRYRPAQPGTSIGHYLVTAGTFGALVRDARTGEPLILSNNHVLANITDGWDGRAVIGDPILQPGPYDGGTSADVIGYLTRFAPLERLLSSPKCRWLQVVENAANAALSALARRYRLRIERYSGSENLIDGAVAKPLSRELVSAEILGIGKPAGVEKARLGMAVMKSGRTSGITHGTIRTLHATVNVKLGDVGEAYMTDQIITTPIGEPGDSGSLVLTPERRAVALLSAGSSKSTVCNRIEHVMEILGVTI